MTVRKFVSTDGLEIALNISHINYIRGVTDSTTKIYLMDGNFFVVKGTYDEVIEKINVDYPEIRNILNG